MLRKATLSKNVSDYSYLNTAAVSAEDCRGKVTESFGTVPNWEAAGSPQMD